MIPCSWKESFGIECMTCGAQRSAGLMIDGKIIESILLFPATIPLLFTALFTFAHLIFHFRNGARIIIFSFSFSAFLIVINFVFKTLLPLLQSA